MYVFISLMCMMYKLGHVVTSCFCIKCKVLPFLPHSWAFFYLIVTTSMIIHLALTVLMWHQKMNWACTYSSCCDVSHSFAVVPVCSLLVNCWLNKQVRTGIQWIRDRDQPALTADRNPQSICHCSGVQSLRG